eukprot:jgi/Mesvir1/14477/Mv05184-RA.1
MFTFKQSSKLARSDPESLSAMLGFEADPAELSEAIDVVCPRPRSTGRIRDVQLRLREEFRRYYWSGSVKRGDWHRHLAKKRLPLVSPGPEADDKVAPSIKPDNTPSIAPAPSATPTPSAPPSVTPSRSSGRLSHHAGYRDREGRHRDRRKFMQVLQWCRAGTCSRSHTWTVYQQTVQSYLERGQLVALLEDLKTHFLPLCQPLSAHQLELTVSVPVPTSGSDWIAGGGRSADAGGSRHMPRGSSQHEHGTAPTNLSTSQPKDGAACGISQHHDGVAPVDHHHLTQGGDGSSASNELQPRLDGSPAELPFAWGWFEWCVRGGRTQPRNSGVAPADAGAATGDAAAGTAAASSTGGSGMVSAASSAGGSGTAGGTAVDGISRAGAAPPPPVLLFDTIISQCAHRLDSVGAFDTLDLMLASGVAPNAWSLRGAMRAAAAIGDVATVRQLSRKMAASGLPHDPVTYGYLLRAMAWTGDLAGAMSVAEEARALGLKLDRATLGMLAARLAERGDVAGVLAVGAWPNAASGAEGSTPLAPRDESSVLGGGDSCQDGVGGSGRGPREVMGVNNLADPLADLPPCMDAKYWQSLIRACAEKGETGQAWQLVRLMPDVTGGARATVATLNTLAHAHARKGDVAGVHAAIKEIVGKGNAGMGPSSPTAAATMGSAKGNAAGEDHADAKGGGAGITNSGAACHGEVGPGEVGLGEVNLGEKVHSGDVGSDGDVARGSRAMGVSARHGRAHKEWQGSASQGRECVESEMPSGPTAYTLTSLIMAHGRAGDPWGAISAVSHLRSFSVRPNGITLGALLIVCTHALGAMPADAPRVERLKLLSATLTEAERMVGEGVVLNERSSGALLCAISAALSAMRGDDEASVRDRCQLRLRALLLCARSGAMDNAYALLRAIERETRGGVGRGTGREVSGSKGRGAGWADSALSGTDPLSLEEDKEAATRPVLLSGDEGSSSAVTRGQSSGQSTVSVGPPGGEQGRARGPPHHVSADSSDVSEPALGTSQDRDAAYGHQGPAPHIGPWPHRGHVHPASSPPPPPVPSQGHRHSAHNLPSHAPRHDHSTQGSSPHIPCNHGGLDGVLNAAYNGLAVAHALQGNLGACVRVAGRARARLTHVADGGLYWALLMAGRNQEAAMAGPVVNVKATPQGYWIWQDEPPPVPEGEGPRRQFLALLRKASRHISNLFGSREAAKGTRAPEGTIAAGDDGRSVRQAYARVVETDEKQAEVGGGGGVWQGHRRGRACRLECQGYCVPVTPEWTIGNWQTCWNG